MRVVRKYFLCYRLMLVCSELLQLHSFSSFGFCLIKVEMAEDKRSEDPTLTRSYKDMERTNTEKITSEILA
jgi:hypothetical protein